MKTWFKSKKMGNLISTVLHSSPHAPHLEQILLPEQELEGLLNVCFKFCINTNTQGVCARVCACAFIFSPQICTVEQTKRGSRSWTVDG